MSIEFISYRSISPIADDPDWEASGTLPPAELWLPVTGACELLVMARAVDGDGENIAGTVSMQLVELAPVVRQPGSSDHPARQVLGWVPDTDVPLGRGNLFPVSAGGSRRYVIRVFGADAVGAETLHLFYRIHR